MRVISGSARGFKLKAPKGLNTRPTVDRIKESLFNIIADKLYGICFLDLFSGSGGIGIEALSRGADFAAFVDFSQESIDVIKYNLKFTKFYDKAIIIKSDIKSAIFKLKKQGKMFDIIFMDPPYDKEFVQSTVEIIYQTGILKKDGFIIVEQSINDHLPSVDGFEIFRVKEYKITKMTFISYLEENYE